MNRSVSVLKNKIRKKDDRNMTYKITWINFEDESTCFDDGYVENLWWKIYSSKFMVQNVPSSLKDSH